MPGGEAVKRRLFVLDDTVPQGAAEARCDRCVDAQPCAEERPTWAICYKRGVRCITRDYGCKDFEPKEGAPG
jgi:hypothetical protein